MINLHRYTTILNAASKKEPRLAGKMNEEEQKVYDWALEVIAKAKAEGKEVKWDIPLDYD